MKSEREVTPAMLATEATRKYYGVTLYTTPDRARARLEKLKGAPWFMSNAAIARRAGICESNLAQIISGHRGQARDYEPVQEVHRDTEAAILGVRPEVNPPARGGGRVPPLGVRRRLRALVAAGFPMAYLSTAMGWGEDPQPVHRIIHGKSSKGFVQHSTHLKAAAAYDKLSMQSPEDLGFTSIGIARARRTAAKHGWTPPMTWDDDTVDDPDAFPEWTGECGTVTGYNLHRKHLVHVDVSSGGTVRVLCDACCKARTEARSATEELWQRRRTEAQQMIRNGIPYRDIAHELGMSTRTVQRAKRHMEATEGVSGDDG